MINEEGGIDPEQFRMEAMFDRMDAIGKSVLGLTIQCAQCHNHKYDPLTQEEYYRLFAFLNNDHEAQRRRLHAATQLTQRAAILRADRRDRRRSCSTRTPDWAERMAAWEATVRGDQPEWTVAAARGRRHLERRAEALPAGRRLDPGAGLRADEAHDRVRRRSELATRSPRVRLELLNDPNLPRGGPGRSIKGTVRADRVRRRSRAARRARQEGARSRSSRATADVNPPETAARADLRRQERQEAGHRAGRVRHRRQGRDRLGHRRRPGPAQRAAQGRVRRSRSRIESRRRSTILTFTSRRTTAAGTATTTRTTTSAASASR